MKSSYARWLKSEMAATASNGFSSLRSKRLSFATMSSSRRSSNETSYATLPSRPLRSSMRIAYRPGGSVSIDFSTDTICACSFFATLPDTKMPRWPTFSCMRPTITCPRALISSVEP